MAFPQPHVHRLPDGSISDGNLCEGMQKCDVCQQLAQEEIDAYLRMIGGMTYLEGRARLATESSRIRGSGHLIDITTEVLLELLSNQWLLCGSEDCDVRFEANNPFEIDHKIPLSRGGTNHARNLQLLCAECNQQKGVLTPKEFDKSFGIPEWQCPGCMGHKGEDFQLCPQCRYPDEECPDCGGPKEAGYRVCYQCRKEEN